MNAGQAVGEPHRDDPERPAVLEREPHQRDVVERVAELADRDRGEERRGSRGAGAARATGAPGRLGELDLARDVEDRIGHLRRVCPLANMGANGHEEAALASARRPSATTTRSSSTDEEGNEVEVSAAEARAKKQDVSKAPGEGGSTRPRSRSSRSGKGYEPPAAVVEPLAQAGPAVGARGRDRGHVPAPRLPDRSGSSTRPVRPAHVLDGLAASTAACSASSPAGRRPVPARPADPAH